MTNLLHSEEFAKLEVEYPFLRRAREHFAGLKSLSFVVVDTETTGLEAATIEITEIAGLKVEKGEITDVFNILINIGQPLPREIIRLTGITDEMLLSGENKNSALRKFVAFIGGLPLFAHNTEFDLAFLNAHINKELVFTLTNQSVCTLMLSRKLLPGLPSHRLGKVAEYFKIPTPLVHRAPGDVELAYQIWLKMAEILEREGIGSLEELIKLAA